MAWVHFMKHTLQHLSRVSKLRATANLRVSSNYFSLHATQSPVMIKLIQTQIHHVGVPASVSVSSSRVGGPSWTRLRQKVRGIEILVDWRWSIFYTTNCLFGQTGSQVTFLRCRRFSFTQSEVHHPMPASSTESLPCQPTDARRFLFASAATEQSTGLSLAAWLPKCLTRFGRS